MRIAFNGHRLAGQRLGVGRYIEYLLRHWSQMLDDSEDVTLFLRQPLVPGSMDYLSPSIHPTVLSPDMPGVLWENRRLRRNAAPLDVLFCPAYTAPVRYPGRLVVATHSVNEIQQGAHSWRYRQTYARLHRYSARQAEAVIVPAKSTRDDVERVFGIPAERITVIPQGTDDCFVPMDDEDALAEIRRRFFGADRPYILFVGKLSTRRNIPLLLRAFARVRQQEKIPHGLLLFGPNVAALHLEDLCRELGIADAVVQTDGHVSDHRQLVPIYNAADLFVHPSAYEGWSMTTVEALACGTAVVAADRGGLAEAVGGAGLMVADLSVGGLSNAIRAVLTDDAVRRDLECRAAERGRRLRWAQTSRATLEVVRAAAQG